MQLADHIQVRLTGQLIRAAAEALRCLVGIDVTKMAVYAKVGEEQGEDVCDDRG